MAKRAELQGWRWWAAAAALAVAVSAVLHVVIAGVIFLTPLKDYVFPPERYVQRQYEPEQIQETADDIRRDTARKLRKQIGQVQEMLESLVNLRDRKAKPLLAAGGETLGAPAEKDSLALPVAGMQRLSELYESARNIETACYGAYEGWRAVTLADQQKISLAQAKEVTQVVRPDRRAGNEVLLDGPVRSIPTFRKFRDEVIFAKNEVNSILVTVQHMRDLAEGLDSPGVGPDHTIAIQLSGTLYQGGSGDLQWGATVGPPLLADEIFPSSASKLSQTNFYPLPGRKMTPGGVPMKWMYIDNWYTIGPFPNPGRQNLDKKFPPESVVDLDATYVGKYDHVLRWRHLHSPSLCVAPYDVDRYAIWYAYTEVWSDEDKDYWVAFGSDDYGKVWVGGKLIWASGKTPHHWIPDRGFRKVRFSKGPNPILFKIENAGGTMGLSMVIAVSPTS